jgi:hypothetical protein
MALGNVGLSRIRSRSARSFVTVKTAFREAGDPEHAALQDLEQTQRDRPASGTGPDGGHAKCAATGVLARPPPSRQSRNCSGVSLVSAKTY